MSQTDQKYIANLAGRGVWYLVALSHALDGSHEAGLMLSQLIYWNNMGHRHDGFFFKTVDELYYETGLTKPEQNTAIRILEKYGLIEKKLAGVPAKRHFKINIGAVHNLLAEWLDSAPEEIRKAIIQLDGNRPTNTEKTHQTTPQTTQALEDDLNHPQTFSRTSDLPADLEV